MTCRVKRQVFTMVLYQKITKSKELPKSFLELDARGFLWVRFKSNVDFDLSDAVDQEREIIQFCDGLSMPFVVDGRVDMANISNEAREYFAKSIPLSKIRKAQALLVNNLGLRILANFYINFNKPNNPAKVFTDEMEAIEWALSQ